MARVATFGSARGRERAQYMVEFGLTFVFFIFVVLATINMMLAAYNFNLAQRASWEAARKAAVGGTNAEVAQVVYDQFVSKMFASPFMISKAEFEPTTWITPNSEADRVYGSEVTVVLNYTLGFSFVGMSNVQAVFPVTTKLITIEQNDEDRDALHDTLKDTNPLNHDNDGFADVDDTDDDNDGIPDALDIGEITWNGAAYVMRSKNAGGAWGPWAGGGYIESGYLAEPLIHILSDGSLLYAPSLISPMIIPKTRPGYASIVVTVDLSFDRDNNGWEDRAETLFGGGG